MSTRRAMRSSEAKNGTETPSLGSLLLELAVSSFWVGIMGCCWWSVGSGRGLARAWPSLPGMQERMARGTSSGGFLRSDGKRSSVRCRLNMFGRIFHAVVHIQKFEWKLTIRLPPLSA